MRNNNNQKKQNQKQVDYTTLIYGKIPPQAKDLEQHLLGIILLENARHDVMLDVKQILKPDDFYVDAHQRIFRAMVNMSQRGQTIDLPLTVEELRRAAELDIVGGPWYVTQLTDKVYQADGYLTYAKIIKQYSIARRLIHFSGEIMSRAYEDDPFDSLEFAQEALFRIFEETKTTQTTDLSSIVVKAMQQMSGVNESESIFTCIEEWDKINGSLFPGLYVVAARPGMGKTAFVVQMICGMAKKWPIALINGEMTDQQIMRRIICNLVEFPNERFKIEFEKWPEEWKKHWYAGIQEFVNLQLHIYSESQKIEDVANMIRFYVKKYKAKAAILDFLQIMSVADRSAAYMTKTDRIDYCLEILRGLSKELGIPIIILSQLNREVNKRAGNFRPGLSDLKGSGTIEEYAFQISFLHRPEYYNTEGTVDEMGESVKGLCYQFIDKHRDGELKMDGIKHRFLPKYSRFEKWEDEYSNFNPMEAVKQSSGNVFPITGYTFRNDHLEDMPDDEDPF